MRVTIALSNTPRPSIRSRRSAAPRRVPANSPSLFSSIRWSAAVISQAYAGHHRAQQHTQTKHQEQAFRGASPGAGKLPLAVFQHPLVGCGDLDERVVQFAAARHYLALEKSDLSFIARVEHGLREMEADIGRAHV